MSWNGIAVEQRQKEIKALKPFLAFSMIGSLVLHVAVLASGIGNLLARVPELKEQPIELTYLDPEVKETPPPVETKQEKLIQDELGATGGRVLTAGSGGAGDGSISLGGGGSSAKSAPIKEQQNTVTAQSASPPPVVEQKQPLPQPIVSSPKDS